MKPLYDPNYFKQYLLDDTEKFFSALFNSLMALDWLEETPNRKEYMMSLKDIEYSYGSFAGDRTYKSKPFHLGVLEIMGYLNSREGINYNVCFLNRYDGQHESLGWHADDFPAMMEHPIASVSLGSEREIWWKEKTFKGIIPPEQRQLLASGSLFEMPIGFQETMLHRIPKNDKPCGPRSISNI